MKGRIPISAAKKISEQYNQPIVLIYGIDRDGNRFNLTTYGETKKLCKWAAELSKQFAEAVMNGTVSPSREEPQDLPETPQQYDGTVEKR